MPSSAQRVRELLGASALAPEHLQVDDTSEGCGSKFDLIIVSKSFEGVKLLERHRLVHDALGDEMNEIHALQMKTWTPEQFVAKQQQAAAN